MRAEPPALASSLLTAIRNILVFAAVFAAGGAAWLVAGVLFQEIDPSQRFLATILLVMFALYAAGAGAIISAVVGLFFTLVPSRARDLWIAAAIGAGVMTCGSIVIRDFLYEPISLPWLVALVAMSAVGGAVSAWCVRPKRKRG